ncbi:hypothetical protein HaLaN_07370 [Haematococcus lacustris]|uniref:Uncharacterized protein n=1 Tax=Haematococcus lacustris TaxID=44745 RepID=A0A699YYX3_HAELA|nr:hypothetical protein HaLaN_07370 [Haematococcus lacustris]
MKNTPAWKPGCIKGGATAWEGAWPALTLSYYDGPVAGTTQADLAAEDTPAATSTAITGPPPPSTLAPTPPAAGLLPAPAPATPPPGGWPVLYLNVALFGILEPSCTPAAYQLLQAESPEACHLLLLNDGQEGDKQFGQQMTQPLPCSNCRGYNCAADGQKCRNV